MTDLQDNQGSALAWVIGIGLGIGALVLLTRPKKAAAATAPQPLLPQFNVPPPAAPASQCTISGPSFSKFSAWVTKRYSGLEVRVLESPSPAPSLADVNKPVVDGGFRLTGSTPYTEENTLLVTRAPNEMVWRYYKGQPTAAPEILKAYCDDVASGAVSGVVWR